MLERRDHGLQVTEPTETPTAEVGWWEAIDKRIQEHLVNERELTIEGVGEALAMTRREIREMPGGGRRARRVKTAGFRKHGCGVIRSTMLAM
jgi:hypothetical protein